MVYLPSHTRVPKLWQLHIPKTGGWALCNALGAQSHRMGHSTRLRQIPEDAPVITTVRDPVARWVSAFDMCARQLRQFQRPYEVASDFAVNDDGRAWLEEHFEHVFRHLTWWLESPEYVKERGVIVLHTETLDDDWETVKAKHGLTGELAPPGHGHRNDHRDQGTVKSVLTPEAMTTLDAVYADDYALLEGLR